MSLVTLTEHDAPPPLVQVVPPAYRQDWMTYSLRIGHLNVSLSAAELDTLIYEATAARAAYLEEIDAASLAGAQT